MLPSALAQLPDMKEKSIYKNTPKHMHKNTYEHIHTIMGNVAFISEHEVSLQSREFKNCT